MRRKTDHENIPDDTDPVIIPDDSEPTECEECDGDGCEECDYTGETIPEADSNVEEE